VRLMSIPESEIVVNLDKVNAIEKVNGEPLGKVSYGVEFSFGNQSKFWWFHSPSRRDQVFDKLAQL
jgi:hypothetical protein